MADNNYITPRYNAQTTYAAYMAEMEKLKEKRKWGTIWNNAAALFDPNHRAFWYVCTKQEENRQHEYVRYGYIAATDEAIKRR